LTAVTVRPLGRVNETRTKYGDFSVMIEVAALMMTPGFFASVSSVALDIAFGDLSKYAYVGVFSSGVFNVRDSSEWETKHRAQLDDAAAKRGLSLVWFSTGRDDFLLDTTVATVDLLKKHGFAAHYEQSTGAHTWINWREYLNKFTPQLFQK